MNNTIHEGLEVGAAKRSPVAKVVRTATRFVRQKPLGAAGAFLILLVILVAIFAALISPYPPKALVTRSLAPPSQQFIFGADQIGRDVFSRIVWGARLSLYVGILAVTLGVVSGLIFGMLTGYFSGWLDLIGQRFVDSLMAFPGLILALALMTVLGASVNNVAIAIAISIFPSASRTIRSQVLGVKANAYVEAARAIGCSQIRIMVVHILPQTMAPLLILISLYLGTSILTEASLSFLGLGVPPDEPSWGGMINGATKIMNSAPWIAIAPGIAISLAVYGFNLLGDALRDVLDPRLRGR